MAEKINAKLGYVPRENDGEKPEDPNAETFKRYEEELEINEFPQTARWKVTSKVSLSRIFSRNLQISVYAGGSCSNLRIFRGWHYRAWYVRSAQQGAERRRETFVLGDRSHKRTLHSESKERNHSAHQGGTLPIGKHIVMLSHTVFEFSFFLAAKFLPADQQGSLQSGVESCFIWLLCILCVIIKLIYIFHFFILLQVLE
jgi:hypothetical protein